VPLDGDLIELLVFGAAHIPLVFAALTFIEQIQRTHVPVRLDKRQTAALSLCFQKRSLVGDFLIAGSQNQFIALRFEQQVHV
jgi:hypothetical protein